MNFARLSSLILVIHATALASAQEAKKAANAPVVKVERLKKLTDVVPADRLIDAGGIKTCYIQKGQAGDKPEILLLHGFGSSTYTWRKNIDELAKITRVTAIDIKGFGLTEKPKDGRYSEQAYVEHVLAAMDALKIKRAVVAGNSMGGAIAARLALENPTRVAGLMLVDAARPYSRLDFEGAGVDTRKLAGGPKSPLAVALVRTMITRNRIGEMLASVYEGREPITPEMIDAYYIPTTIEGAPEALLSMMSPPQDTAKPIALQKLACPTVILWGKADNVIPLRAGEALARELPAAEFVVWEGAGHLPHEDRPADFNNLVLQFLARCK